MPSISSLLEKQPSFQDVNVSSDGYVIWLAWEGDLDPNVGQTLQDYGGLCVTSADNQALWFFFSADALLALAKLVVWGKYNSTHALAQIFPGSLRVGMEQSLSVSMEGALARQNITGASTELQVWVHPRLQELGANIPGLSYTITPAPEGAASLHWARLGANPRLPYVSSQGWYALLRPLGNPLDKGFQAGWRFLFEKLEAILHEQKLKYSLNDNYLMVPLENLSKLRIWVREVLSMLSGIRQFDSSHYWPCVSAIVDRRGLNFNNELPHKVNIEWNELMPDYPYMSYRNAYLLGEGFAIQDLSFSCSNSTMDTWCTVRIADGENSDETLPLLMSGHLLGGRKPCFYCGVGTHEPSRCPTHKMETLPENFWEGCSDLALGDVNGAYHTIELELSKKGLNAYTSLMEKEGPPKRVLSALFAVNDVIQPRSIERIWRLSGKDIHALPEEEHGSGEESPVWKLLERFLRAGPNDLPGLDKDVQAAIIKITRDWRLRSLRGFIALERGDYKTAATLWHEAEVLSSSVLHQAWHTFLQARLHEIQGHYNEAMEMYETVGRLLPQWELPMHRRLSCRVKMGFAETMQAQFMNEIRVDPALFNRLLVDPELERGHVALMTAVYPLWQDARKKCVVEKAELERLGKELQKWFPPEHELAAKFMEKIEKLRKESDTENYLAYLNVCRNRPKLEDEMNAFIQQEIKRLQDRFKSYLGALEVVRDEASWFPFQRALVEFNKDFNTCASILNRAFTSDFHSPEAFRQAQASRPLLEEKLAQLEKRLKVLRMARDATLFMLILLRGFFWLEVIGLILCMIIMCVLLFFGDSFNMLWLQRIIKFNFWELQKVLLVIISIAALGIASVRSTLTFEKRRDKMLEEARSQREAMQRARLQKAREQREAKLKKEAELANLDGGLYVRKIEE